MQRYSDIVVLFMFVFGCFAYTAQARQVQVIQTNLMEVSDNNAVAQLISPATAVGWGKEIGTALHEAGATFLTTADGALTITETHLTKFADSPAGKFTMFVVAWKLMGEHVLRIFLGLLFFIVAAIMLWRGNQYFFSRTRVLKSETKTGMFSSNRVYDWKEPLADWDGGNYLVFIVALLITIATTFGIMFAGT